MFHVEHFKENKMKEKAKFLWIYTGILFSFALILIVFAYLTQNNMYKETSEISKGYQSNIQILTKEKAKEIIKDIDKSKTSDLQNYIIDKINE